MKNSTILKNLNFFKRKKTEFYQKNEIKYSFTFVSLISPFITNNICFIDDKNTSNFSQYKKNNNTKIYLKQSYILLVWFYYLSSIKSKRDKKNRLSFFVLPVQKRIFTNTKAPMAHKNWSKEQYKFKFFKIRISLNAFLDEDSLISSVDSSLLFIILNKKNFPFFETNLMFLKNFSFFFKFNDTKFFNFHNFIRKKII